MFTYSTFCTRWHPGQCLWKFLSMDLQPSANLCWSPNTTLQLRISSSFLSPLLTPSAALQIPAHLTWSHFPSSALKFSNLLRSPVTHLTWFPCVTRPRLLLCFSPVTPAAFEYQFWLWSTSFLLLAAALWVILKTRVMIPGHRQMKCQLVPSYWRESRHLTHVVCSNRGSMRGSLLPFDPVEVAQRQMKPKMIDVLGLKLEPRARRADALVSSAGWVINTKFSAANSNQTR